MGLLRKIALRASAVLLGLAAAGLGGEVVARARLAQPLPERRPLLQVRAHPTRGWEMVPSADHYTYDKLVRVNALGLRGPELEPKGPDELRVLALGDSMVYGQGVAEEGTLPYLLERRLEQHLERPVTVVNGGLRAYDTLLELALLEDLGPRIDPDLVLLFWYGNDFALRDAASTAERLRASGPIAFDLGEPARGLALWRWHLVQLARRSVLANALQDARQALFGDDRWLAAADHVLPRVPDWFDRFHAECRALGARGQVLVIPAASSLPEPDRIAEVVERLVALEAARGRDLPVLDQSLRAFIEREGYEPIVPYDGHWAAEGNRALAEDAFEVLVERGLLGGPGGAGRASGARRD